MVNGLDVGRSFSHYLIISKIGAGGMGEVYLAQDTKLDRKIAIKFLNEEFSKDADKLRRFVQEAKAASALNHPNILTIYEIGEIGGKNYIATELIDGETLRDHLSQKDALQLNQILKIGVQVSEALSAAHHAGIIHRDIKPENIMIRKDGYAKVLDFGLAKLSEPPALAGGEDATRVQINTTPGMVMGTVSYMSPEQARGKATDARTDIWSLGVVLYEMLAGKLPFTGETVNHTIVSILEKEPQRLENVPDELQRMLRKSLTKDVDMRYQSAHDLLIDLKNLRRDLDIKGELERSVVPTRETRSETSSENATQFDAAGADTTRSGQAAATQNVTTSSSSLEYAVTQAKSHKLSAAIIGVLLLGAISAVAYFGYFNKPGAKQIDSIAVMPFVNESGDADIEYLSDGMTQTLISSLSSVPNLSVKPRSTVFRYKGKETDSKTIGKELNVQAILNGRVVQRGDQLTLTLELVEVEKDIVLWSQQYIRKQSDLLSLQSEIARDVSSKLKTRLSGAEEQRITKSYTQNAEAYQLYLKGRYHLSKADENGYQKSLDYFQQAIDKDPNYALAYVGIANAYDFASDWYLSNREAMGKAKAAAMRALEIDDTLAEAHASLAQVRVFYEWNWSEAEKEIKRAIELNPNYSDAHRVNGFYLGVIRQQHSEAIEQERQALQLDPLSFSANIALADAFYNARQYDDAIEQLRKTLEMDQNLWATHEWLGEVYERKGQFPEAIAALQKARQLDNNPLILGKLGRVYARSGNRMEAQKLREELRELSKQRYVSSNFIAEIYAALGERDKAFEWLEKGYEERSVGMLFLNSDPLWDGIRSDPRFTDLLRRVGLPQ